MFDRYSRKRAQIIFEIVTNSQKANYKKVDLCFLDIKSLLQDSFSCNVDSLVIEYLEKKEITGLNLLKELIDNKHNAVCNSLELIDELFTKNDIKYVVFKSIAPYRYYKDDVDVLVVRHDYNRAKKLLKSNGFKPSAELAHTTHFDKQGFSQIDLHERICWNYIGNSGMGPDIFDTEDLMGTCVYEEYCGREVPVPCKEYEFLCLAGHSIFQHGYINMGELLFFRSLINRGVDKKNISNIVDKYGWGYLLNDLLDIIERPSWNSIAIFSLSQTLKTSYYFGAKNGIIFGVLRFILYSYRYLINFKFKGILSFNPVSYEIRFIIKGLQC